MLNIRLEEKTFTYKVPTQPGTFTPFTFSFKESLPWITCFSIQQIKWTYGIPSSVSDPSGYGWPRTPLLISIDGLCQNEASSPLIFNTPIVTTGISGTIRNDAHLQVELCIHFQGNVVCGDTTALSKEQLSAFIALDAPQRALFTLQTLATNQKQTPQLVESKNLALPQKESAADSESLMSGDLFLASKAGILPIESISALSDFLLKKGWKR